LATAVWVVAPALQWGRLQTACRREAACASFQLNEASVRTLNQHGLGLTASSIYIAAVLVAIWALWYGLGALIIWRRPAYRGALLAAFFLAVFPVWEGSAWVLNSAVE